MRLTQIATLLAAACAAPAASAQQTPAAVPPAGTPADTALSPNDTRVRCRTVAVTGSLVRQQRICMTLAEWRRHNSRGNAQARDLVGIANRCGGGAACQPGN